jgi:K+-sensing histidine kinase KdpD
MTDKVAQVALWVSGASLLVSITSAVIAWRAKEQARKAATLEPRTKAIGHLREALFDINNNGLVRRETVNSIQAAMHLSVLVFGQQVREALDKAYMRASRLC